MANISMTGMKKLLGKVGDALSSSFLTDMLFFLRRDYLCERPGKLGSQYVDGLSGHGFAASQEGFPAAVQLLVQTANPG